MQKGERVPESEVTVAGGIVGFLSSLGRIINKRSAGSKLYFYDIRSGETMLQVMSSLNMYDGGNLEPDQVAVVSLRQE